jgi:hypothetical protein
VAAPEGDQPVRVGVLDGEPAVDEARFEDRPAFEQKLLDEAERLASERGRSSRRSPSSTLGRKTSAPDGDSLQQQSPAGTRRSCTLKLGRPSPLGSVRVSRRHRELRRDGHVARLGPLLS